MKKKYFLCLLFVFSIAFVYARRDVKKTRFAFATDVHLNIGNHGSCFDGFRLALDQIKKSKVDFVIFGGDLCDVSGMSNNLSKQRADSMFTAFRQMVEETGLKSYYTIGNHDRYFDSDNGYVVGDELFKSHLGNSYYTFEHAGIRFFVLNSVQDKKNKGGFFVGDEQIEWLKRELSTVPTSTPIVVSTHVPVYSIYYPVVDGKYIFVDVIANYMELRKVFEKHNLKLVLQGHQHLYEEIYSQKVQYITGGAVSASWWSGQYHGTEEGFLIIEVDRDNKFTWEYVDYGWTAK
jgi:3',5'-cyclic AMP phosphodiesterase CpdA